MEMLRRQWEVLLKLRRAAGDRYRCWGLLDRGVSCLSEAE